MAADLSAGACAGVADESYAADDIFYPKGDTGWNSAGPDYRRAAAICAGCPIRDLCLQDALTETVQWGYRAGTTPEQRQKLMVRPKPRESRLTEDDEIQRHRAYRLGWSDKRIGELVGKSDRSIRQWRTSRNLPPNFTAGGDHKPIRVSA